MLWTLTIPAIFAALFMAQLVPDISNQPVSHSYTFKLPRRQATIHSRDNRFHFLPNLPDQSDQDFGLGDDSGTGGRTRTIRDLLREAIPSDPSASVPGTGGGGRKPYPRFTKYQIKLIHNITQILDNLLYGYDNRLRPGYGRQPATVNVDIMIRSMGSISEMNMDFTMSMYFRQTWRDERLAFEGPVKILPVSIKILEQIWKPDTYFHNGKDAYVHSLTVPNRFLRIDKNGGILYSTRLTVKARCPMDLADFPMDQQICPLLVGSFGYDVTDVVYKWSPQNPVTMSEGLTFSQFEMVNIKAEEFHHTSHTRNTSMLGVNFHFRRHIGYFLLQIYLPCILIVILSWVSFWINREATADRVGLSITSVLALSAFFLDARSDLPKSPYPTQLDKFVFVCLFYVSATLLEFACVHYYTKFGTGELFLSELLDVKLGYLPGASRTGLRQSPQKRRSSLYTRSSTPTVRKRIGTPGTPEVFGDDGNRCLDHEGRDLGMEPRGSYSPDKLHRSGGNKRYGENREGYINQQPPTSNNIGKGIITSPVTFEWSDTLNPGNARSEARAPKPRFRLPGAVLLGSLVRLLRLLLHCHLNILSKLWGCVAGKPKWGGGQNSNHHSLTDMGMGTNSVSLLDRFSKVVFPLSFLIYNYFYWKPYFTPLQPNREIFPVEG